ncbi:MAG: VCBS repeat-containing protein [Phycisphaerae bacterium]
MTTARSHIQSASRRGASGATLALLLCIASAGGQVVPLSTTRPGDDFSAFERFVKPAADDWQSEIDSDDSSNQLAALGDAVAAAYKGSQPFDSVATYFTPDARLPDLCNAGPMGFHLGALTIRRSSFGESHAATTAPSQPPAAAFRDLMTGYPRGSVPRFEFKTVGVEPQDETHFTTHVVFHAYSGGNALHSQQNAHWLVHWLRPAPRAAPRIRAIEVESAEQIFGPALFAEATRALFADAPAALSQLSLGCDYWYGRIDAVGEINFMGHNGIAVGDVNGDGLDDLYVAQGTGLPNLLLVQQPNGSVRDTAHAAGVDWLDDTKGVLLIDFDNDGDQDLVCAIGPTILFQANDGRGNFKPVAAYRDPDPAPFYSLAAADYDGDGDLDLYACRYVKVMYGVSVPVPFQDATNGPANVLLRNDGPAGFHDVTAAVGLNVNNNRFSTAAGWADFDNDGDPDLYVSNDFGRNNLYRNDGGHFTDVAAELGVEDQAAGMGVCWGDVNNDGRLDLYVSNMYSSAGRRISYQPRFHQQSPADVRRGAQRLAQGNTLFVSGADGRFVDATNAAGVRLGRWSWGSKFVDLNNDGLLDLLVPNGFLTNAYKDDL